MVAYAAVFSPDGLPTGFFLPGVNCDEAPSGAVTLTEAQWREFIANPVARRWDGAGVVPYAPPQASAPVPASVTNFQARAALINAGLFAKADAAVRNGGDALTAQGWDYANNFYRASAMIANLAEALGLSAAQVDDLFRSAAAIDT